jgi:hypothetical protein
MGDDQLVRRMLASHACSKASVGEHVDPDAYQAVEMARQAEDRFALVFALWGVGHDLMNSDPPRARPVVQEGVRVAQESGNEVMETTLRALLGSVLFIAGELREARSVLESVIGMAVQGGDRTALGQAQSILAMVLAGADERADARAMAQALETTAREGGLPGRGAFAPLVS